MIWEILKVVFLFFSARLLRAFNRLVCNFDCTQVFWRHGFVLFQPRASWASEQSLLWERMIWMIFLRLLKEWHEIMHSSACHCAWRRVNAQWFHHQNFRYYYESYTISHSHKQCIRVQLPHTLVDTCVLFFKNYYGKNCVSLWLLFRSMFL